MPTPCVMWPERLPGTLEELDLFGLGCSGLGFLAWAPESSSAGRLPWLQTIRMRTKTDDNDKFVNDVPLLEGLTSLPHLEVSGMHFRVCSATFDRYRSVRIVARGRVCVYQRTHEDLAAFVDRLCPAGLQAAELCAEQSCIYLSPSKIASTPQVVRAMIDRHGDCFAIEVVILDKGEEPWNMLHRLAWRRWPAPGAPGLPAARAAHERARAWASENGQGQLEQ
jgi:hypothetical protein